MLLLIDLHELFIYILNMSFSRYMYCEYFYLFTFLRGLLISKSFKFL